MRSWGFLHGRVRDAARYCNYDVCAGLLICTDAAARTAGTCPRPTGVRRFLGVPVFEIRAERSDTFHASPVVSLISLLSCYAWENERV